MTSSARLRGRRALVAGLTVLGLLATAAATLANPADPTGSEDITSGVTDAERDARLFRTASVGPVREVEPDPLSAYLASLPRVFATYDGVDLLEISTEPLAVGFHQAGGGHPALTPVGDLLANDNPGGTDAIIENPDGPAVRVMPSRGRGGSGTSAVDVALSPDSVVHSPVTGTVVGVHEYSLYGKSRDVFLEIQPRGRPDLRVLLYHVRDVHVSVGDRVYGGLTPIAGSARDLPVTNQVDRFAEGCPCPHVDIRLRHA